MFWLGQGSQAEDNAVESEPLSPQASPRAWRPAGMVSEDEGSPASYSLVHISQSGAGTHLRRVLGGFSKLSNGHGPSDATHQS